MTRELVEEDVLSGEIGARTRDAVAELEPGDRIGGGKEAGDDQREAESGEYSHISIMASTPTETRNNPPRIARPCGSPQTGI